MGTFRHRTLAKPALGGLLKPLFRQFHGEVRRISLLSTRVNKGENTQFERCATSYSARMMFSYTRGEAPFGARERKNEMLGQSPSPELRKRLTSCDTYTIALRSQNSQVAKFTYVVNF